MARDSKNHEISHSFKRRLQMLSCPYTEDVDESWILELVFKPGESRILLIQWLFSRYDSSLGELIEPLQRRIVTKMDSRIERLFFVAHSLGLCKSGDIELIRGTETGARQLAFMDKLLDLVLIRDSTGDPETQALRNPAHISGAMPLDEQFQRDCGLVDALAAQQCLDTTLGQQAKLLPADVAKAVATSQVGNGDTAAAAVPDPRRLRDKADLLASELDQQRRQLAQLQEQHPPCTADAPTRERVRRQLSLALSQLSQLLDSLAAVYEGEMRAWCDRRAPHLTPLGPAFEHVHSLLAGFTEVLGSLRGMRTSYETVTGPLRDDVARLTAPHTALGLGNEAVLDSLQEAVSVLETSLSRHAHQPTTLHCSFNASTVTIS